MEILRIFHRHSLHLEGSDPPYHTLYFGGLNLVCREAYESLTPHRVILCSLPQDIAAVLQTPWARQCRLLEVYPHCDADQRVELVRGLVRIERLERTQKPEEKEEEARRAHERDPDVPMPPKLVYTMRALRFSWSLHMHAAQTELTRTLMRLELADVVLAADELRQLEKFTALRELSLSMVCSEPAMLDARHFPHLRTLLLEEPHHDAARFDVLLPQSTPASLTTLRLDFTGAKMSDLLGAQLGALTHLSLIGAEIAREDALVPLGALTQLRTLDVRAIDVDLQDDFLFSVVQPMRELRHLLLSGCIGIHHSFHVALEQHVPARTFLRSCLEVENPPMSGSSFFSSAGLSVLPTTLESLALNLLTVLDDGCFIAMRHLVNLRELAMARSNFSHLPVSDQHTTQGELVAFLTSRREIRQLALDHNAWVSDAVVTAIVGALPHLEVLDVTHCATSPAIGTDMPAQMCCLHHGDDHLVSASGEGEVTQAGMVTEQYRVRSHSIRCVFKPEKVDGPVVYEQW